MSNIKKFEQEHTAHQETARINAIILANKPQKSALNGINYLIFIYALLSVLAALELTASGFFYAETLGLNFWSGIVLCTLLGFGFHFLLHLIQSETASDWIFKKQTSSSAMLLKMRISSFIVVVLLGLAACFVCFIGKTAYISYAEIHYTPLAQSIGAKSNITAEMLTNNRGKISAYKLEQLAAANNAQENVISALTTAEQAHHNAFKIQNEHIADVIGSTAFILEFTLLLLCFGIASTKRAAVIHVLAAPHAEQNATFIRQTDIDMKQDNKQKGFGTNIGFKTYAPKDIQNMAAAENKTVITNRETVITPGSIDEGNFAYGDSVLREIRQHFRNYLNKIKENIGLPATNKSQLVHGINRFDDFVRTEKTSDKLRLEIVKLIESEVKPLLSNLQIQIL